MRVAVFAVDTSDAPIEDVARILHSDINQEISKMEKDLWEEVVAVQIIPTEAKHRPNYMGGVETDIGHIVSLTLRETEHARRLRASGHKRDGFEGEMDR